MKFQCFFIIIIKSIFESMKKIILSIILLIFQFHIHAQTSFILSENGEVENQENLYLLLESPNGVIIKQINKI